MKLVHGGDIYSAEKETGIAKENLIDFSANLNPLGMADGVREAIVNHLDSYVCYPDPLCRELTFKLSQFHQIPREYMLCGNGAADLIFRLIYARKPKRALVLAPTFAEYAIAMKAVDTEVIEYLLEEENGFNITEDLLDVIDETIDMIFICNPNNPTGVVTPLDMMKKLLTRCEETGTLLVVDECFNDFIDNGEEVSMLHLIKEHQGLFILKAFTKMYAMAGLRLGYGLCSDEKLLARMSEAAQAWSVSTVAQIAGIAALKETEYVKKTQSIIRRERKYLKEELGALGMKVYSSKANYIFFRYDGQINIKEKLKNYGILIRSCDNYTGLDERYYRIAVRSASDNTKLITYLKQIMSE